MYNSKYKVNKDFFKTWSNDMIAKQEQVTIGQLADFDFVDLPAVDQYRHMIKAQPKQKLDLSIQTEYPALQTIVYHSKKIKIGQLSYLIHSQPSFVE